MYYTDVHSYRISSAEMDLLFRLMLDFSEGNYTFHGVRKEMP